MRVGAFLPTYWTDYGATTVREAVEEAARVAQALGYAGAVCPLGIRTYVLLISARWRGPPPPVADICWRQDRPRSEHGRRRPRAGRRPSASPRTGAWPMGP